MVRKDIACLLPIRSDGDIVYKHFVYYYNLGVRDFYALIHCGTAEDKSEMERFAKDSGANVNIIIDNNPIYNQDKQYMILSQVAREHKWHIMSDTDELLILKKHKTLVEYLEDKNYDAIQFKWFAYCNTTDMPMFEWKHRSVGLHGENNPKSIMRYRQGLRWSLGHHYIHGTTKTLKEEESIAFYGHFRLRNIDKWKERQVAFADAKRRRFGMDNSWYNKEDYKRLSNGTFNFKGKACEWKNKTFIYDMKYDPIPSDLFVLK